MAQNFPKRDLQPGTCGARTESCTSLQSPSPCQARPSCGSPRESSFVLGPFSKSHPGVCSWFSFKQAFPCEQRERLRERGGNRLSLTSMSIGVAWKAPGGV